MSPRIEQKAHPEPRVASSIDQSKDLHIKVTLPIVERQVGIVVSALVGRRRADALVWVSESQGVVLDGIN